MVKVVLLIFKYYYETNMYDITKLCKFADSWHSILLNVHQVYVNRLGQYEEAINVCQKYLQSCPNDPLKSRLWLMLGVAEGGLARSCHLIADQNVHNKRGLESILQVTGYSFSDMLCCIENFQFSRNLNTVLSRRMLWIPRVLLPSTI